MLVSSFCWVGVERLTRRDAGALRIYHRAVSENDACSTWKARVRSCENGRDGRGGDEDGDEFRGEEHIGVVKVRLSRIRKW